MKTSIVLLSVALLATSSACMAGNGGYSFDGSGSRGINNGSGSNAPHRGGGSDFSGNPGVGASRNQGNNHTEHRDGTFSGSRGNNNMAGDSCCRGDSLGRPGS